MWEPCYIVGTMLYCGSLLCAKRTLPDQTEISEGLHAIRAWLGSTLQKHLVDSAAFALELCQRTRGS